MVVPLRLRLPPAIARPLRAASTRGARLGRAVADKYPFTALGTLLLSCGYLAVLEMGQKRQDYVLYVAGLGLLAVVLVAGLLVVAAALVVGIPIRPRTLAHARFEAGRIERTGFTLPSLSLMPLVSLDWDWLEPLAVRLEKRIEKGRLVEEVIFGERGEHEQTVRRVVIEDVLGIARVAFQSSEYTPRTIRPALGRPLASPLLEAFAAGDAISHPAGPPDGDPIDMRRYVAGDPMKRVLWKVYARSRNLMVRLPERAISPTHRTLAYLVAGEGDEAAAAVARIAVESDALGPEWRFGADLPPGKAIPDATDAATALSLIVASRGAREQAGAGLGPFLERNELWGGRCVVFAGAQPGPGLEALCAEARRRPGRLEVVLGVDGVRGAERAGRWRRLFLLDGEDDDLAGARVDAEELGRTSKALTTAGASVTVVDRPTGKVQGRSGRRRRAA